MIPNMQNVKTRSLLHWKETVERRRAQLSEEIDGQRGRPLPDFLAIQGLKRERARLKDDLTLIEGVLRTIRTPIAPEAA
ncbi:MAG: YdcH family protein [Pseudomonadota bacterium]